MDKTAHDTCPIDYGLQLFGDRWTLLILRDMIFRGKRKFSEFSRSHERIASNVLTTRLARLAKAGLVTKHVPESGGHPSYVLTGAGADLIPVIVEIIAFSARHGNYPDQGHGILHGAPDDLLVRFEQDRDTLMQALRKHALS